MNRKTYTFDEAFKASLDYFTGDELAAKVWVNKYALKDAFGNIYEESPVDMHHRLASEIARVEKKYPNPLSVRYAVFSSASSGSGVIVTLIEAVPSLSRL